MFMKKKIHALLLTCLCMQPMQAITLSDYIPNSITVSYADLAKGLGALFVIYYIIVPVCRYAAKQAATMYVANLNLMCIEPALSGELIGVNAQSGRDSFRFLMDLQKHKSEDNLRGPLGWIAHKILTGEAESTLLNCPLFRGLPHNSGDKLNLAPDYKLNANGSLMLNENAPCNDKNPQSHVEALLQHTGKFAASDSKVKAVNALKTWSQHSIFMKTQLQQALVIAKKDPSVEEILNAQ